MAGKDLRSPEDVINQITAPVAPRSKTSEQIALGMMKEFKFEKPIVTAKIKGFESRVAADLFAVDGNRDAAKRADTLCVLLGDRLYGVIRTAAKCDGIDDELHYLGQKLFVAFEADEFDVKGATEPFDKEVDGNANSETNIGLAQIIQKSNLGRLVQIARANNVSNTDALRWGILNMFLPDEQ